MPTTTLPTCDIKGCTGHLGKFGTCTAEALYDWSTESGQDETIGATDQLGWFAFFNLTGVDPTEYGDGAPEHTYAAAILTEYSTGHVIAETFDDLTEAQYVWRSILNMYYEYDRGDRDGDE